VQSAAGRPQLDPHLESPSAGSADTHVLGNVDADGNIPADLITDTNVDVSTNDDTDASFRPCLPTRRIA
jgi:hypothetical protein